MSINPYDDAASASLAMLASAPAATVPPFSIQALPMSKSRPSLDLTFSTWGKAFAQATLKYSSAILGSDRPGTLLIEKQMSENDVAGLLQRRGEDGILIAGGFEISNFLQERWRSPGAISAWSFCKACQRRVALGSGKGGVEGDYASACSG